MVSCIVYIPQSILWIYLQISQMTETEQLVFIIVCKWGFFAEFLHENTVSKLYLLFFTWIHYNNNKKKGIQTILWEHLCELTISFENRIQIKAFKFHNQSFKFKITCFYKSWYLLDRGPEIFSITVGQGIMAENLKISFLVTCGRTSIL